MVKQQVDEKLVSGHFKPVLPSDECEASAKFEQKARDVSRQRMFDIPFLRALGQTQKVKIYGILERVAGKVGLRRRQTIGKIRDGIALTFPQRGFRSASRARCGTSRVRSI